MRGNPCLPGSTKSTLLLVTLVFLLFPAAIMLWYYNRGTKEYKPPLLGSLRNYQYLQDEPPTCMALKPDGEILAIGSNRGVTLWDNSLQNKVVLFDGDATHSVVFSSDGNILATGQANGTIWLWDWHQKKKLASFPARISGQNSMAFTLDCKTLVATGKGETPGVEHHTGVITLNGETRRTGEPFDVVKKGFGDVDLWSVPGGEKQRTLTGHGTYVHSVAISPDGATLATVDQNGDLKLWDTMQWEERSSWKVNTKGTIAFSPDGKTLASAAEHDVELWDVDHGMLRERLHENKMLVFSLAFSADGKTLAAACGYEVLLGRGPGRIYLWNLEDRKRRAVWWNPDEYAEATLVVFSPDSKTLLSTTGLFVRRWDVSAISW